VEEREGSLEFIYLQKKSIRDEVQWCLHVIPVTRIERCLGIYCQFATQVWGRILRWLGVEFMLAHSLVPLLNFFVGIPGGKYKR
jgi:hypothetical protein